MLAVCAGGAAEPEWGDAPSSGFPAAAAPDAAKAGGDEWGSTPAAGGPAAGSEWEAAPAPTPAPGAGAGY